MDSKANSEGFFSKCGRLTSQKFYILRKPKIILKKIINEDSNNSLFVEEFPQDKTPIKKTIDEHHLSKSSIITKKSSFIMNTIQPKYQSRSFNYGRQIDVTKTKFYRFEERINKRRERSLLLSRIRLDFSKITEVEI